MIGYGTIFVAFATALYFAYKSHRNLHRRAEQSNAEQILLILYTLLSGVIFLHVQHVYLHFVSPQLADDIFADWNFQNGLALMGISSIVQVFMFSRPWQLFLRLVIIALINVVLWGTTLVLIRSGIINIVWFVILTISLAFFIANTAIFGSVGVVINRSADANASTEIRLKLLELAHAQINGLLKTGISALLALGGSVGVSMSILFHNGSSAWSNRSYQLNAIELVIGFCLVALGVGIWIMRPYLQCLQRIQEILSHADFNNPRLRVARPEHRSGRSNPVP